MELFIVDSGNQKATGFTQNFKTFMRYIVYQLIECFIFVFFPFTISLLFLCFRNLCEPRYRVLHWYGKYHGNVKKGLRYNDTEKIVLS